MEVVIGQKYIDLNDNILYHVQFVGRQVIELKNPKMRQEIFVSHETLLSEFKLFNPDGVFADHVQKFIPKHIDNKTLWLITGLIEESGEVLQILRKSEYKNETVCAEHLTEELGDTLYFIQGLANHFKLDLKDIMDANVLKLNKRFPKGHYDIQDAIKKVDHES